LYIRNNSDQELDESDFVEYDEGVHTEIEFNGTTDGGRIAVNSTSVFDYTVYI